MSKKLYFLLIMALVMLGTVFQSLTMFRSSRMYDFGIGYWGPTARDGVWHQAVVGQLVRKVPPENPGFAGEKLTNYHYFYNLLVAGTHRVTGLSVEDLIYRFYPLVFSLLFGIGTYCLSDLLFKNKLANIFGLFFAYFGSSFGWVVEFIRERHFGGESAFWMNQPVSMNLNPPFAASMVMVIWIVILLLRYQEKKSRKIALSLIILSGLLIEIKVYAGIIVLGALLVVSVRDLLIKRDASFFLISLPAVVLASFLFVPQVNVGGGFFEFKPFWFIHSMIDSPDRVGWLRLASARTNYLLAGNWPKYFLAEVLGFLIYIIGNLGTRVMGLFVLVKSAKKYLFIFTMTLISFLAPLLFIQRGNPWNTIQFSYYFLYFMALFAGHALTLVLPELKPYVLCPILFILLIITPVSSYTTFTFAYTNTPPARLTGGEYEVLKRLGNFEPGVVLTPPYNPNLRSLYKPPFPLPVYDTNTYVSAFSGMPVYIEDENQQVILGNEYRKRVEKANVFFTGKEQKNSAADFLEENNISYVYLPKLFNYSMDNYREILRLTIENNEAYLYEVVK